jgi:hypothetical protein
MLTRLAQSPAKIASQTLVSGRSGEAVEVRMTAILWKGLWRPAYRLLLLR